jgi:hypothetical protein
MATLDNNTRQHSDWFDSGGSDNPARQIGDSLALFSLAAVIDTLSGALGPTEQNKCIQPGSAVNPAQKDNRINLDKLCR